MNHAPVKNINPKQKRSCKAEKVSTKQQLNYES